MIKCKYLKVCKQMYEFASSTRAGAGCISVQSYSLHRGITTRILLVDIVILTLCQPCRY